jgi:hypothetical protein
MNTNKRINPLVFTIAMMMQRTPMLVNQNHRLLTAIVLGKTRIFY